MLSISIRRAAAAAGLAVCLALLPGCDRQSATGQQAGANGTVPAPAATPTAPTPAVEGKHSVIRTHVGKTLAVDRLPHIAGPVAGTSDLLLSRGRPTLVNLWATWCAPCVAEMPTLDALARRVPNLRVVAVSQDMQGAEAVTPWLKGRKLDAISFYADAENKLLDGSAGLPTTILLDAAGKEVWRVDGPLDWNGPVAAKLLAEAGIGGPAR